jgi:isochorismate synthase
MALAGSAARGQTPDEDETLAAALLASAKDRHEHELVVAAVRAHLAEAADELTTPSAPVVLRLRNIQHLLTLIAGRLRQPGDGALQLARRLHPTPAMGGVPPERALAFLRHAEPVPRGWYAAPIGWIDSALDGVFAVGIRSAITQHDRAWLYAGAGIVAGSSPEREWAETALKFRPMLGALGATGEN